MNPNKYTDAQKVTARKKAQFIRACEVATSKKEIYCIALTLANDVASRTTLEGTVKELAIALYAVGLCAWKAKNAVSIEDFVTAYILWKFAMYTKLHDTGAIGDVVELIVHLVAAREQWRTQLKNLHVSALGRTDVQIGGVKYEVGHNAKVWADATIDDAMKGPFEGVIYGMISNEEMRQIATIMRMDFVRGVTEVADLLYVFPNKADFLEVMQNQLGRSATLKYRHDLNQIITVYNDSKTKAWINRMEGGEYLTLTEHMKALGKNDWLK